MRILALDWGRIRIGAAISDETGKLAFALDRFFEAKTAIDELVRFIAENGVDKIIVGNPISLSGEESESSKKASQFVAQLKLKVPIEIETLDERFTSVAAQKVLSQQGLKQKEQRFIKDNIAAQIMLQQYLDSQK